MNCITIITEKQNDVKGYHMDKSFPPTYYCKNIYIILRHGKDRIRFESLLRRCVGMMDVVIYQISDGQGTIRACMDCMGSDETYADIDVAHTADDTETIWITDIAEVAKILQDRMLPVLGWSHPGGEELPGVNYLMENPGEIDLQYLERVYRRAVGIPWDILETDRCFLRETTVEDVEAFYRIYRPESITRYMEDLFPEREREEEYLRTYIEKVYRYFEFGVWTVIEKATGEIIGRAGLSVRDGYDLPELGFVIGEPWQGQGIAYEICRAILQYGREEFDFHIFQALVQPENLTSVALCRKLGFTVQDKVIENEREYLYFVLG